MHAWPPIWGVRWTSSTRWSMLWLGQWELAERIEVPYRVVINEAVELAKRFGAEQSHRYVNGVLDRLAADLRSAERSAGR